MHKQYGKSGKVEKVIIVNTGRVLSVALGCEKTGPYSFFRNVIQVVVVAGINFFY